VNAEPGKKVSGVIKLKAKRASTGRITITWGRSPTWTTWWTVRRW
jgi:hypothetical protein